MTDEQLEKIVTAVACGRNTFASLDREFPDLPVYELHRLTVFGPDVSAILDVTPDRKSCREYRPDDVFTLTERGENIWYRIQKERRLLDLTEKSVSLSEESLQKQDLSLELSEKELAIARWTFIAGVCAAVFSFLALLLPLVEFIRTL